MYLLFVLATQISLGIYEVFILILLATSAGTIGMLVYTSYLRRIKQQESLRHEQALAFERNTKNLAVKTQEDERRRIAKHIHDDIGNQLQILLIIIRNIEDRENPNHHEQVTQQINDIIESTRILSHRLYPATLEHVGLLLTLQELTEQLGLKYVCNLHVHHRYKNRSVTFEVQVYRIIQEFVSNTIKHAAATAIDIHIRDSERMLTLLLSDDGIGFDINSVAMGIGLKNIRSRVDLIKGTVKIKSRIKKGTRYIILFNKEVTT